MHHLDLPQSFSTQLWRASSVPEPVIYPFCTEETVRRTPWKYRNPERGQDFLIVTLLLAGEIVYQFPGKKLILRTGMLLTIPPYARYSFSSTTGYWKLVLEISGTGLIHELHNLSLDGTTLRKITPEQTLFWRDSIREQARMLSAPYECLPRLLGKTMESLYSLDYSRGNNGKSNKIFQRAQNLIDSSLEMPIDLTYLQEKLHISHSSLGRLFQKYAGRSPREYWIERKMHRAKYYLEHTDLSIKEIAELLGYSSQFHFSGEFSKREKSSPRRYREIHTN